MNGLTDLILSFVDLVETQVRAARRGVYRLGVSIALLVGAGLLAAAGLVMLGWALFWYLQPYMLAATAILLSGLALLLVAVIVLGISRWLVR